MKNNNLKLRKDTVFKKARELSTLCGVDVALILYDSGSSTPQTWSSTADKSVVTVLNKYLSMTGQPLVPQPRRQCDTDYVDSLGVEDLNEFDSFLAGKIQSLNNRIDLMKEDGVGGAEAELNLDDVEFTFDDDLDEGFGLPELGFGIGNGVDRQQQSQSQSTLLDDEDFDWMKELDDVGFTAAEYDWLTEVKTNFELENLMNSSYDQNRVNDGPEQVNVEEEFDWLTEVNNNLELEMMKSISSVLLYND